MGVKLYPYQQAALMRLTNGDILCGGVGSGKSRTALAYYYSVVCGGLLDPFSLMPLPKDLYIITTARKRDTLEWEKELIPFLLKRGSAEENDASGVRVIIDSWNNIKKYSDVSGSFFIFDEQRVVGSGAWVKSFIKISKTNEWLLLTATPGDSWMDYIPVFIANGFYKNRSSFVRRHVVYSPFTKFPKIQKFVDTSILEQFRASVLVNMDYKNKNILNTKLSKVLYPKKEYSMIFEKRWSFRKDEPIKEVSGLTHELRRCVNEDPSRIHTIKSILSKHPKLIVFYNYDYELDILKGELGLEYTVREWNGHVHQAIPTAPSWVYLVQYTAGAEGWNCIETNAIAFYSLNYSYKIMTQAAGRIDRLNTTFRDLYFYWLLSDAPIDQAVFSAIRAKKIFNERAFLESQEKHRV